MEIAIKLSVLLKRFIGKLSVPLKRENVKLIAQFILTLLFIGVGIWFIIHEKAELGDVKSVLISAKLNWMVLGLALSILYVLLQGAMYVASFASMRSKIRIKDGIILFLKRNFISVFLPAGGISSLAFFSSAIEKKGVTRSQIYFASSVYAFVGIVSVVIVAIPAFLYAVVEGSVGSGEWYALAALVAMKIITFLLYRNIYQRGVVFSWLSRIFPSTQVFMDDLQNNKIDRRNFLMTVLISVLIEFVGIAHLFVSMKALGFTPTFLAAVMGYIISVIFLIVSPFLRGLGAVEVSMVYVLTRFGFSNVDSISITFLYRFFEFWLPFVTGMVSFIGKVNKLLARIVPALLLLVLGVVNIISVLTPAISGRLEYLEDFLFIEIINASNSFVLIAGMLLLITAAFMLKGLRTAWWFALILTLVSFVGHLTKAIDYEEATVALVVILILLSTRKEYYVRTNPKLRNIGIQTSVLSIFAVLIYGIIGFYFLDKKHFDIDFNLAQSVRYTIQYYFLIGSNLVPVDHFARYFLYSISISGFASIAFVVYAIVRPYVIKGNVSETDRARADQLLKQYGNSGMDYFKTCSDKLIYAPPFPDAFISYRVSGNYAVVLENPVAADAVRMKQCIAGFDRFCYEGGLKSIYYRVPEESLPVYASMGKKSLFIGQEAIVDLSKFTLEGGSRKPMRNALNKVRDKGYKTFVHEPPVKDGLLQKLRSVSDEWLKDTGRSEIVFSQGMFDWNELKKQTILTVENAEEKIIAFLNVIPDYCRGEGTYDLIRKTADAPNGIMDFILVDLFNYFKQQGLIRVNLGFAPLSGLNDPHTFPEKSMKFAYERIRSFAHYKGLREYKEKFFPEWFNKYLVYDHDYDLIQVPRVLSRVIKP